MSELLRNDVDPVETSEWLQALESLLREEGPERARFIIDQLTAQARKAGPLEQAPSKQATIITGNCLTIRSLLLPNAQLLRLWPALPELPRLAALCLRRIRGTHHHR